MRAKISDFGLARELDENDTYYKSRGGQLPVRWSALEALEDRKFNEKTDVYSFGVALHEIWTRAALPFQGWTNQRVWVEVAAGYRLPCPEGCPGQIYAIMFACWSPMQTDRPSFFELGNTFRRLYEELAGESLSNVGYLAVADESEGEGSSRESRSNGGALARAFGSFAARFTSTKDRKRSATTAHPNPGYLSRNGSAVMHNPLFEEATSKGSELYDMGEDDVNVLLPKRRDQDVCGNGDNDVVDEQDENAMLYDIGDMNGKGQLALHAEEQVEESRNAPADSAVMPTVAEEDEDEDDPQLYGNFGQSTNEPARTVTADDIGKRVLVQGYCGGVLRFYGPHKKRSTLRCGVVLDEPVGMNDGTVGVRGWGIRVVGKRWED